MESFKTFMSLTNIESVSEITSLLKSSDIQFKVQDTSKDFDITFSNDDSKNSYLLMLNQKDFEKASSILEDKINFNINEIDSLHPLFTFSIEELKDVVKNYDEWYPLDVKLAKYLLKKQNIVIEDTIIKEQQLKKQLESEQNEKTDLLTILMGYVFCIFGGLLGIAIAVFLLIGKRTVLDGSKQYIYSKSDRNHGKYMLLVGAVCFGFFIYNYL